MRGLIGRKVGMTQVFDANGVRVAVTVIDVKGNTVIQKKVSKSRDGYTAVKLGYGACARQEKSGLVRFRGANKAEAGVFAKLGIEVPRRHVREFRLSPAEIDNYDVGKEILADEEFSAGDVVDVIGTCKGRGFMGVVKRHGFVTVKKTHGTHEYKRHGGAIGASADPSRVIKGKRMPGQFGNTRKTVQNLNVVEVLPEDGVILVRGGVPGPNGGIVLVQRAKKKARSYAS